ncbi:hypothetical protein [Priestia aryabhattai]|uniref:hypothetical protein n=1 Tax=Priestia aryabhattai TaxID=412384 RepID=UPI001C8D3866|nr:hypothetical protein [Priestia aryabhattai]MBY0031089.1 hypothetical protein [Priestia aryabhattai]
MPKKIFDLQNDILVLFGIFFALRFIYTKEIYMEVNGYTINTFFLLIYTIIFASIHRQIGKKKTNEQTKSNIE